MEVKQGRYVGAGTSAMFVGLGFIPTRVEVYVTSEATAPILVWTDAMGRGVQGPGGQVRTGLGTSGANFALLAQNAGIEPWDGGNLIASASAHYIVPASEIPALASDQRDAGAGPIRRWTLGNAGNRTGNFDAGALAANVGRGSVIEIDKKRYKIQAMTSTGDSANEVTLDRAAPSGNVDFIGYKFDFGQAPAGTWMPKGIKINDTTYVNVASRECEIRAYRE